jgi:hypothetical protein
LHFRPLPPAHTSLSLAVASAAVVLNKQLLTLLKQQGTSRPAAGALLPAGVWAVAADGSSCSCAAGGSRWWRPAGLSVAGLCACNKRSLFVSKMPGQFCPAVAA